MPPTHPTEEIIEKKASSPIATSCLVIAVVALMGGMIFQLLEIGQYRRPGIETLNRPTPGVEKMKADIEVLKRKVKAIVDQPVGEPGEDGEIPSGVGDPEPMGDDDAAPPGEPADADVDEPAPELDATE
ncbi:MAG TPA: hypothetical protein VMT52_19925 [Planctomycetota bacterium]|nr:hypothetical protein [Planctomycetota bacterium]